MKAITSDLHDMTCQYSGCGKHFKSGRRWVKKYCSDSCRTLASRYRKAGLGGSKVSPNRSKGINDLYVLNQEQHDFIRQWFQSIGPYVAETRAKTFLMHEDVSIMKRDISESSHRISRMEQNQESEFKRLNNKLDVLQKTMDTLLIAVSDIRSKQASQDWVVILSSILGPKVGDWMEKNLVNGGQSKEDEIMKAVTEVKKMVESGKALGNGN